MEGHVLIVAGEPSRRTALRTAFGLAPGEARELDDPAQLPARAMAEGAEIAVLDLGPEETEAATALDALRRLRARPGGPPLPVLALMPADRPGLRFAALRAGAEEATCRDTPPRVLQARLRSLLRHREAALESSGDEDQPMLPGLAEAPATFLPAAPRLRLGLLVSRPAPERSALDGLARLLGADVTALPAEGGALGPAMRGLDLVVIDARGTAGDLAQGARVLALLSDLRSRPATRDAATLVLLPADAIETAALALDLGVGDIIASPTGLEEVALRARALLRRKVLVERRRDQVRSQLRAAMTDSLTGLHNLHHADPALRRMAESARRDGGSLAVMMLDIDHFKSFNDRYGHATGNRVLIEVGRRLKSGLRPGDLLARVGGEEFIAALPGATLAEARTVAERLRHAVAERPFAVDAGQGVPAFCVAPQSFAGEAPRRPEERTQPGPLRVRVTLSIGVAAAGGAEFAAGLTPDDLLARADLALYAAKAAGRNAVAAAPVRSPLAPDDASLDPPSAR